MRKKEKLLVKEDKPQVQIKQEEIEEFNENELMNQSEILVNAFVNTLPDLKQEYVNIKEETIDIENIGTEPFPSELKIILPLDELINLILLFVELIL